MPRINKSNVVRRYHSGWQTLKKVAPISLFKQKDSPGAEPNSTCCTSSCLDSQLAKRLLDEIRRCDKFPPSTRTTGDWRHFRQTQVSPLKREVSPLHQRRRRRVVGSSRNQLAGLNQLKGRSKRNSSAGKLYPRHLCPAFRIFGRLSSCQVERLLSVYLWTQKERRSSARLLKGSSKFQATASWLHRAR